MPRISTSAMVGIAILTAIAVCGVFMLFTTSKSASGSYDLRLSELDIAGKYVTHCKDLRLRDADSGDIDFSKAASAQIEEFEAFALQHSRYFSRPQSPYNVDANRPFAAKRCLRYDRTRENQYVMSSGTYPVIATHNIFVKDGQVYHIDSFYLNRDEEDQTLAPDVEVEISDRRQNPSEE